MRRILPCCVVLLSLVCMATAEEAPPAESVLHFGETSCGSAGAWEPVGRTTIGTCLWSAWDPGQAIALTIEISQAGQMVHGMHMDGLGLPLPRAIRFRAWGDTNYLFVVVGDSKGHRAMSRIPLPGLAIRAWSELEVPVDELLPVGLGAELITDFDQIAVLTRESAGEYRWSGPYRYYFKDFRAVYAPGVGPTDPPRPTRADLEALLEPVPARIERIDELLESAKAQGIDVRYPMVSRTVLERYRSELFAMLGDDTSSFTMESAHYLLRCAERTETELERMLADPSSVIDYPTVSLADLTCREGSFFSGDRPVMLTGLCGWFKPQDFVELSRMGYTCVTTEVGPCHTLPEGGESAPNEPAGIRAVLDAAQQHNMAMDLLLSPHYFPGWAREQWPTTDATGLRQQFNVFMPWTVTDPHVRDVIAQHFAVTIPYVCDHPALLSYDLINEAWYRALPDYPLATLERFREKNPGVDEFQALSDVSTESVTEFLDWNIKELHKYDTRHPVHIKAIGTDAALSVDREAIGDVLTANGMDSMQCWPDFTGRLAMDIAWPLLRHDFHRSLQPDQPILDAEFHMTAGAADGRFHPNNFAYAALWDLALHGRDMGCNWVYGRGDGASVYWHVNAVEALGRTSLDLLRLAPEVHAFQRQQSPLALYYGGVDTTDAYLACLFQDRDVKIVTDKRIGKKALRDVEILVVPWPCEFSPAVEKRVRTIEEHGGRVMALPRGKSLEELWQTVHEAVQAACPEPLVQANTFGVECRSVQLGERRLLYVLNHRPDTVVVRLCSEWPLKKGVDLRTQQPIRATKLELEPLAFHLIEVQ